MKLSIINLTKILVCFLFFAFVFSAKAYAAAPDVEGYVLTKTGNPVYHVGSDGSRHGVWVRWTDSSNDARLVQADPYTGRFLFPSWHLLTDAQRQAQFTNYVDSNLDGTADTPQAYAVVAGVYNQLDIGFGCGQNPHTFTAILPYGWGGSFSTLGNLTLININNSTATVFVGSVNYLPPAKRCVVNPIGNNPSVINFSGYGNAYNYESEPVRLWIEQSNGAAINPAPAGLSTYNGISYYLMNQCSSQNRETCGGSVIVNLPVGNYYAHCDVPNDPRKCSGNPFCNGNEIGGTDCTGWANCSSSDAQSFSVISTPSPTPSPTPVPPTLGTMTITGNVPTGYTGKTNTTGRLSLENGRNWNNPITIVLNATKQTNDLKEFYISLFTARATDLDDAKTKANTPSNGFLLRYLTDGTYQYYSNGWRSLSSDGGSSDPTKFFIQPGPCQPSGPASSATQTVFCVTFYQGFGSKVLNASAHVKDTAGLPLSSTFEAR